MDPNQVFDYAVATLALAGLGTGLAVRKQRRVHGIIMTACCAVDLLLVAKIEVINQLHRDSAVGQAGRAVLAGPHGVLFWHVLAAASTVALYLVVVPLGWRAYRGRVSRWHVRLALAFLVARVCTYGTSFFIER